MKVTLLVLGCLVIQLGGAFLIGRFIRTGRDRRCTTTQGHPALFDSQDLPLAQCTDPRELSVARSLGL